MLKIKISTLTLEKERIVLSLMRAGEVIILFGKA
jgi:hypothetical protein